MKEGEKSIVSTNKRAADERIESSAKRPKQALGEGGENNIDNQSALEDEQKNFSQVTQWTTGPRNPDEGGKLTSIIPLCCLDKKFANAYSRTAAKTNALLVEEGV